MVNLLTRQIISKLILFQFLIVGLISCNQLHSNNSSDEEVIQRGEVLFQSKCSTCHKINVRDGFSNGYFWRNIPLETEDEKMEWMVSYLRNSDSLVQSGDTYAIALKEEYNNSSAIHEFGLSEKEVFQIVTFLRHYYNYEVEE